MSVEHQVFLVLCTCIVYCVLGIRSIVYWVLGNWVLGPYVLEQPPGPLHIWPDISLPSSQTGLFSSGVQTVHVYL